MSYCLLTLGDNVAAGISKRNREDREGERTDSSGGPLSPPTHTATWVREGVLGSVPL